MTDASAAADSRGAFSFGQDFPTADPTVVSEAAVHTLHVHASPNNTILTLTDHAGRVLINCSGGTAGFRKAQRSGPEAAYQATQQLVTRVSERGLNVTSLHLKLNGFGPGRESVFRAIRVVSDWDITRISDATPVAFNGCRPRKARRL
ncbi:hypothetical protein THASP1DRAFT_16647 [Thamnocephalis sphaerospora]|uniref:Ribosomal protein S11-domain-containing protein n=1 Tax=Thamnocephalis sphaerospora TaxID=78915 RepID=A0A4P9XP28_9FUNG|nr:hypothetical protein THASP1DRAFT_16647 [Thamnocephalis sphaerospora]|eukprot:RKP07725.1 hypothetical protein THASP1DRAFT_16647 [Thamnocephalis sphaerospora]